METLKTGLTVNLGPNFKLYAIDEQGEETFTLALLGMSHNVLHVSSDVCGVILILHGFGQVIALR